MLDVDPSCAMIVRKNGKTSLHTAGRYGLLRIVKALIDKDAAIVGIKDKKGQTALHMAVKGRSLEVVEEILQADYTILNERDRKGNTALHIATRKSRPQVLYCSFLVVVPLFNFQINKMILVLRLLFEKYGFT